MPTDAEVLIVGAGPTGLVLALWLTQQGVRVRIVDQSAGPGETSRAMAVQARTLELYRQLDLSAAVVAAGHRNPALNLWAQGRRRAHLAMDQAGAQVTPYPFVLTYPQDQHERLLVDRLRRLGVEVERQTEFLGFEEGPGQVRVRLRLPDGREMLCPAAYLCACDGARSPVRHQIGLAFEGGTYQQTFYVADVKLSGLAAADEVHIAFDEADFVIVLSYGDSGLSRLIGVVSHGETERLSFDDVGHQAIEGLGLQVDAVNWFSTYRVHHRVSAAFSRGRAFLLGDAAHVHSPAGGQGMNTGIADAVNLAWKLAAVLRGGAAPSLLDSYGQERRAFAETLVASTDRLFSFVTAPGQVADFIRVHIAPRLAGAAYRVGAVRELIFRLVSQTRLNYRGSALSLGTAGRVQGGDRLPWVLLDGEDNYRSLSAIAWQVHVYGSASAALQAWAQRRGIQVHQFAWHPRHEEAGLARDAAYLLRPDTYVAVAEPDAAVEVLERYFTDRGFAPHDGF